ncbi:putative NRPS-like protein biosynthetic cluster [Tephrocybe sp. NHM501043]|nr:putative NRPS-like protein biosynthetic cluster [Tephrocybe sp. NHM501043]
MASPEVFSTVPDVLLARSQASTAELGFLDADGSITLSLSYPDLFVESVAYARQLVSAGLRTDGRDIVITSFPDHENHIPGIPVCPIPQLHPDQSRRAIFFEHLQSLFNQPTLIAHDDIIEAVTTLVPTFKTLSISQLASTVASPDIEIFPKKRPQPDDIVCFMLTSGSTGNSKAVGLRHSNILSSIEGKIKHHETTSKSRFLNWIAFDHVACVTEIHLQALRADASQFHVSPTAIIRTPRNLLDWCSKLRISYTFSPNFLLAQICRDVTVEPYQDIAIDLSSVRAFISGGESVPVRTAVDFTEILERFGAPRNVLRGGFGMTETGAGCIYDTRHIPCDVEEFNGIKYLSLGKCCNGTNVRVIDAATGAICRPLQEGKLQLKGPTIFCEYHNNPKATAESFSDGWFITGDTALLDEDGNLHLMGRDKDCININGVKHPSVDIENYLEDLRIDGLSKSFIYVCPMRLENADTETYAVFYQHRTVVEGSISQDDLRAIAITNRAIKNACFIFCAQAPHVILPLARKSFVKTALGKISRSSLVAAYLKGEFETIQQSLIFPDDTDDSTDEPQTVIDLALFDVISSIFDVAAPSLTRSQNLFDIGASSMHLMQLKQRLQERLFISDIPTIELLQRPELGDLSDYLTRLASQALSEATPSGYNPLVCFNPTGLKPPLFLVHPGVGEVLVFINLARELADDRPVYALRARGFDADQLPFTSFDEMVDTYSAVIEQAYPSGPYYLGGYSFGGAAAFEIGKRLTDKGKDVAWVGVFNLPPHIQFRMKELVWVEVMVNLCMFLGLIQTDGFEALKAALYNEFPDLLESDEEPPSAQQVIQWTFDHSDQDRLAILQLKLEDFKRWVAVAYAISYSGRNYEPRGFVPGALLTVFCAIPLPSMGTREEFKQQRLSKWEDFAKDGFDMIDVDGEHYTMLSEEHVISFAGKLREALERAHQAHMKRLSSTLVQPSLPRPKQDFDAVPIVDFLLAETDPEEYFRQLSFALEDVGFAVFVNVPGFEDAFQKELFHLAEDLFSKPLEWKEALGTKNSYSLRGYFRADDIVGGHKAYAEAYRFGADLPAPEPKADSEVPFWLRLHEGPNQWPVEGDLPSFRNKMETLFDRYHSLNLTLNQHICQLLDIPNAVLDDFFPAKTEFNSALWHYFPVTPDLMDEAKDGPGLQAQNHQGQWVDIPYVEGGVVCNIGVQLMKLTGGRLVATLHRVNTLKIDKDRYTIPYVLSTKLEKPVFSLPQFANPILAKTHAAPNPRIQKLMAIEDPLIRSGFARLSLFPAVTRKLYPVEFEEGQRMGIL